MSKKRNIAIQLVLQKCCKTSWTFFVARFKSLVPTFFTQIDKEDERSIILPCYVDLGFLNLPPPPHPLESDCVKEVILLTRFSDTEVTKRFYLWTERERSLAIPRSTILNPSTG